MAGQLASYLVDFFVSVLPAVLLSFAGDFWIGPLGFQY